MIRRTCFHLLPLLGLLASLGSTTAEACDPRVTTRPEDLWGRAPVRVVRDHRLPGGSPSGGVVVTTTPRDPIVRDHRRPGPLIRDHRR